MRADTGRAHGPRHAATMTARTWCKGFRRRTTLKVVGRCIEFGTQCGRVSNPTHQLTSYKLVLPINLAEARLSGLSLELQLRSGSAIPSSPPSRLSERRAIHRACSVVAGQGQGRRGTLRSPRPLVAASRRGSWIRQDLGSTDSRCRSSQARVAQATV